MNTSSRTLTAAAVPFCTCAPDGSSRQSLEAFLQCPMAYTMTPYPTNCVHTVAVPAYRPPQPRLVGIEPNPGPRGRNRQKKINGLVVFGPKNRPRPRRSARVNPVLSRFLASAENPLAVAPPHLGFGDFVGMNTDALWQRQLGIVQATTTNFAIIFNPATTGSNTGAVGTANQSFLKVAASTTDSLVSAASFSQFAPTTVSTFTARAEAYRPITAAVRITVRYPATSMPGRLFGFVTYDSDASISALKFSDLVNLDSDTDLSYDASGIAQLQVNWRQMSPASFDLQPTTGVFTPAIPVAKCVIVGFGWPANAYMGDVSCLTHVEYTSGVEVAGPGPAEDASIALSNISQELLAASVRNVPSVLTKDMIANCQMRALTNARRLSNESGGLISDSIPSQIFQESSNDLRNSAGNFASAAASSFGSAAGKRVTDYAMAGLAGVMLSRLRNRDERVVIVEN